MGYIGVGTLEFLYSNGEFYFIEMNTRLQVEHTVTEEIYNIDLVKEQIKVALGEKINIPVKESYGHSIQCRINAENPITFAPSPGRIADYLPPGGHGVRIDSALYPGYRIPVYYDSLIAKMITHGKDRKEAIAKTLRSLDEYVITGIDTNIELHKRIISSQAFVEAKDISIKWLEEFLKES